jgi:hypothetical protein
MKTLHNASLITLAVAALTLLVASPVAMADAFTATLAGSTSTSETYTATTTQALTELSDTLIFPQFNPSLGTLQSVEITLSGSGSSNITGSSTTSAILTELFTHSAFTLTGGGQTLDLYLVGGPTSTGSPAYTLTPSVTITSAGYNGTYTMNGSPVDSGLLTSGLSAFSGTGDIDFNLVTFTQLTTSFSTGNASLTQATTEGGTVTITYDYSETPTPGVPEPGTLSLFGTGLLGLAGMLRSRFSKAS